MKLWICGLFAALIAMGAIVRADSSVAATKGGPSTLDAMKTMLWNEIAHTVFEDSAEHADHYVFYVSDSEKQDLPAGLLAELPTFKSVDVLPLSKSGASVSGYVAYISIEPPVMMGSDTCMVHYTVKNGESKPMTMTLVRRYDLWQVMPKATKPGEGC